MPDEALANSLGLYGTSKDSDTAPHKVVVGGDGTVTAAFSAFLVESFSGAGYGNILRSRGGALQNGAKNLESGVNFQSQVLEALSPIAARSH